MRNLLLLVLGCLGIHAAGSAAPASLDVSDLAARGRVLMLRHAHAPGYGDPANIDLADCGTQRNLDAAGRAQARALGEHLRRALGDGAPQARIYTSEWCRCRETAELLGLAKPVPLPALNSFFQRPQDRESNMAALHEFLLTLRDDGPLVVLVTHQVNITALTGIVPLSGEGIVLGLRPGAAPEFLGEVRWIPSARTPVRERD